MQVSHLNSPQAMGRVWATQIKGPSPYTTYLQTSTIQLNKTERAMGREREREREVEKHTSKLNQRKIRARNKESRDLKSNFLK